MSIREFPRLITEVIRGTHRYRKLKAPRPPSERMNSTAKDDLCVLSKPKVRGLKNVGIVDQMAVIVVLGKMITRLIVKSPWPSREKLHRISPGPKVPKFILNLIQRE